MSETKAPLEGEVLLELWDSCGTGLIIECSCGIWYSNQTEGTCCSHPRVEGLYVPVGNESDETGRFYSAETQLLKHFYGPKHQGTGARDGLDEEDIALVQSILDSCFEGKVIVDLERAKESREAWVRVKVLGDTEYFRGFNPFPRSGVFTWLNSD